MEYTQLSVEYEDAYFERFKMPEKFAVSICREDPVKFAYFMFGKTMWKHQAFLIDAAINHRFNIWCLPRQIGKSVTLKIIALWATWFNVYRKTENKRMDNGCSVYIVSRTEDQAKEMLLGIRALIRDGDAHMSQLLRKSSKHMTDFFSSQICEPNNVLQISFKNGATIKCVPPTDSVRGKSADWLIIDEAAFLKTDQDPDKLFYEAMSPTVAQTDGRIILSSTPRGQSGFFFKIIDPYNNFPQNDYNKVWFNYTILDVEHYRKEIENKEKELRSKGEGKSFEQEYEAKFVADMESFFNSAKIDEACGEKFRFEDDKTQDYVIGIDYGMVASRTTVAISRYDQDEMKIVTGYVKRFNRGMNINDLIPFVKGLMDRYNITAIVADDCPEGFAINQQMLTKGWNVILFNFTREKTENYCSFRARLNNNKIGILPDRDLIMEMKGMMQEETITGKLKMQKGGGLTDDLCDAMIMSASIWLKEDTAPYSLELV